MSKILTTHTYTYINALIYSTERFLFCFRANVKKKQNAQQKSKFAAKGKGQKKSFKKR